METLQNKLKKRCRYCRKIFTPDPRIGDRQISCGSTKCKKKRKQIAHKKWSKENPDYFHDRYGELRAWRERNPGYQKEWRRRRSEIQDKI